MVKWPLKPMQKIIARHRLYVIDEIKKQRRRTETVAWLKEVGFITARTVILGNVEDSGIRTGSGTRRDSRSRRSGRWHRISEERAG